MKYLEDSKQEDSSLNEKINWLRIVTMLLSDTNQSPETNLSKILITYFVV
jgi:hypothetical protein